MSANKEHPLLLTAGILFLFLLWAASSASANSVTQNDVGSMQPGWNHGNTDDALPIEISWGNAAITPEYAQALVLVRRRPAWVVQRPLSYR